MTNISQSPTYNLKAVLRETGLKADVLRAWERRYELPKPHRTPSGHRLYSEYDIRTVKWLRARQAEGLSISRAVELWKEIIEAGRDPLMEYSPALASRVADSFTAFDTRLENLRQNWLEAILAFDSLRADEALNQAFSIYPVETVCTAILQQGIGEIGKYWYLDKASVQQEHFATALATRRLEALITATPRPTRDQSVMIGCPPGERHVFSVLLLTLMLRRRGLDVVYLGADNPIEQLAATADTTRPDLIVLAAQQLSTAATLQSAALILQRQGFTLAYGGLIFNRVPELRQRIPAYFLGETLEAAIQTIERVALAPGAFPGGVAIDETFRELARQYREMRPLIEVALLKELQAGGMRSKYLEDATSYLGDALSAALELGDLAFLESDLDWVKALLSGRQIPAQSLLPYLSVYSQAIRTEMGAAGAPVTDWIESYVAQNEVVR